MFKYMSINCQIQKNELETYRHIRVEDIDWSHLSLKPIPPKDKLHKKIILSINDIDWNKVTFENLIRVDNGHFMVSTSYNDQPLVIRT